MTYSNAIRQARNDASENRSAYSVWEIESGGYEVSRYDAGDEWRDYYVGTVLPTGAAIFLNHTIPMVPDLTPSRN